MLPKKVRLLIHGASPFLAGGLFASCAAVGEDYERPTLHADQMEHWNGQLPGAIRDADQGPEVLAEWWATLEDPVLTELIERAAVKNLDLRTAQANLRRAQAARKIADSLTLPTLSFGGAAEREISPALPDADQSYSADFEASWELDVFGGIERAIEAVEGDLQATEEYRRDVLVSVLAEVALGYVDLRTLQRRRAIAIAHLSTQEGSLDLIRLLTEHGAASKLDLARAQASVETTRSRIPAFDQPIRQTKNLLAILIGETPGAIDGSLAESRVLPLPRQDVAVGVPAEVLRRRPDVRMAERQLAAETARVGVAIADLYPKFSLNGTIGLESLAGQTASVGPRVRWNLFDGGRTRQQIEVRSAVQERALIQYERATLTALSDVEDAITAYIQEWIRHRALTAASEHSTRAADGAVTRHRAGDIDFLDVLVARRTELAAKDRVARSEGRIFRNLIRLYKALGGGWTPDDPLAEA